MLHGIAAPTRVVRHARPARPGPDHFLGHQDDNWEDIVTMSTGRAPRRATSVMVVIVAAIAAGAAAPAVAGGHDTGRGGASGGAAPAGVPAERGSLCELRADNIRDLRGALPGGSEPESLRDAVWLLEERIEQWNSAAEGLRQAAPTLRSVAAVDAAWREALRHHDAGKADATRSSLAKAESRLVELDRQLRAAPIPGCR